jgi:hypothetical protein
VSYQETQIIKPRKSPALIIGGVIIVIILLAPVKPEFDSLKLYLSGLVLFIFGALYLMLSKIYIVLANDGITFKLAYLKKEQTVLWHQITFAKLEWYFTIHSAEPLWVIFYDNTQIKFQPSYYSRKHLRAIAEAFIIKCSASITDKKIKKIAEGKFPWYLF